MKRLMYLTKNIDELDNAEHELENKGIPRSHINVLSNDANALARHDLPRLSDWSSLDITYYGLIGAVIGFVLAVLLFAMAYALGASQGTTWSLVGIGAVVIMGFAIWEAGLVGVSKMNHRFDRFQEALKSGAHLLIVDVKKDEAPVVEQSVGAYPDLKAVA